MIQKLYKLANRKGDQEAKIDKDGSMQMKIKSSNLKQRIHDDLYTVTSIKVPSLGIILESAYSTYSKKQEHYDIVNKFFSNSEYLRTFKNKKIIEGGVFDLISEDTVGYQSVITVDPSDIEVGNDSSITREKVLKHVLMNLNFNPYFKDFQIKGFFEIRIRYKDQATGLDIPVFLN